FYLLYRWDLTDEPFPDLSTRSAWYDVRLIKATSTAAVGGRGRRGGGASTGTGAGAGAGGREGLAYNSQRDWVVKAFGYAGIASTKKTHVGRSSGAKTAELKGISEDQIRPTGRWNQKQMVVCYLNSLPRKFMRSMAGHPPQLGCFEISRAAITPPDELLSMIWPDLDTWKGRFGLQQSQVKDL